jgi:hypothetical protein
VATLARILMASQSTVIIAKQQRKYLTKAYLLGRNDGKSMTSNGLEKNLTEGFLEGDVCLLPFQTRYV